ncbi:MAG: rRNA maturation RNase YbeY [Bacilli bacterium]|nr:rRNA maturation RNase YbeY [Bacilli bacterium]
MKVVFNETNKDACEKDLINISKIVFKIHNIKNPVFNIVIVDKEKIKEINKLYRKKDKVTDVISFAFEDNGNIYKDIRYLGEIYICAEVAEEQAKEYGHSYKREICYLAVHGLMHLLGYDHMNEDDKRIMRSKEEEVLNEYDLKR